MSRSLTKLPTPGNSGDDNTSPQRVPGSFQLEDRQGYPPIGYFPPPSASSRALPSSSSQPVLGSNSRSGADHNRSDSPFTYSYLRGPSSARHVSDPATTANHVDPFQYMTAGPRAPTYTAGAAAVAERGAYPRGSTAGPAAARSRKGPARHDTESSEEEEDDDDSTASDEDEEETDNGRRPPVHNTRSRAKQSGESSQSRRHSEIVVEVDSESEPEAEPDPEPRPDRSRSSKSKKPSRSSSSANPRRKSTGPSSSSAPSLHTSRQRKRK
ncbi:hypothetical protein HMPREF1624_00442 [Sporothrix schenckii ATCC 58251]|uniref:Uncharacterized protein n=1 Tax=Sporothrix schenckii (strain ATCC 58251 / de Perez 2211183) TaxID=1391915 RepID=U7Q2L5_SPOS1|nr:hypothetical protein HMPREF1624_00442 [Sporothrix schenckii ATCC 58251]